jgi:hypothetical protein
MAVLGFGILGGVIAWFGTMLIGQPLYELIKLRRRVAWAIHMYDPEIEDDRGTIAGWVDERANSYREYALRSQPVTEIRCRPV